MCENIGIDSYEFKLSLVFFFKFKLISHQLANLMLLFDFVKILLFCYFKFFNYVINNQLESLKVNDLQIKKIEPLLQIIEHSPNLSHNFFDEILT